jgi:hypothetical protein
MNWREQRVPVPTVDVDGNYVIDVTVAQRLRTLPRAMSPSIIHLIRLVPYHSALPSVRNTVLRHFQYTLCNFKLFQGSTLPKQAMSDIPRNTILSDASLQDQQRVQNVHLMAGQTHMHTSTAAGGAVHNIPHHHDPHVPLESDPARQGQHDGTTYALGEHLCSGFEGFAGCLCQLLPQNQADLDALALLSHPMTLTAAAAVESALPRAGAVVSLCPMEHLTWICWGCVVQERTSALRRRQALTLSQSASQTLATSQPSQPELYPKYMYMPRGVAAGATGEPYEQAAVSHKARWVHQREHPLSQHQRQGIIG